MTANSRYSFVTTDDSNNQQQDQMQQQEEVFSIQYQGWRITKFHQFIRTACLQQHTSQSLLAYFQAQFPNEHITTLAKLHKFLMTCYLISKNQAAIRVQHINQCQNYFILGSIIILNVSSPQTQLQYQTNCQKIQELNKQQNYLSSNWQILQKNMVNMVKWYERDKMNEFIKKAKVNQLIKLSRSFSCQYMKLATEYQNKMNLHQIFSLVFKFTPKFPHKVLKQCFQLAIYIKKLQTQFSIEEIEDFIVQFILLPQVTNQIPQIDKKAICYGLAQALKLQQRKIYLSGDCYNIRHLLIPEMQRYNLQAMVRQSFLIFENQPLVDQSTIPNIYADLALITMMENVQKPEIVGEFLISRNLAQNRSYFEQSSKFFIELEQKLKQLRCELTIENNQQIQAIKFICSLRCMY